MSLSLVPYTSRDDSRDVVLRHEHSIVIRDPQSKQLILREDSDSQLPSPHISECPYCHQTIQSSASSQGDGRHASRRDSFVSPEYFRMLSASFNYTHKAPSSPASRLLESAYPFTRRTVSSPPGEDVEFVGSTPATASAGQGITEEAFSQNYYKKFFVEERVLGKGGKGVVYLVKHVLDGVSLGHFACKRVPVGNDHAWLEKVLIEVQLLQSLSHPNLVSYRHVWLEDFQPNRFGPPLPCAFILQQYCDAGDLLRYVAGNTPVAISAKEQLRERRRSKTAAEKPNMPKTQRKLNFEEIYSFFKDITSGLAHLHASNYIHRDLKPSNCLLSNTDNGLRCLISDFGEVQSENAMRSSTGATGTISYCAPEVLTRGPTGRYGEFTTKSDVFSLGMILYFMCFNRLPYSCADAVQEEQEDLDSLRAEIGLWSGFHDERKERPELPAQLYGFLKRLLALDPTERPSAGEILQAISSGSNLASSVRHGRYGSTDNEQSFRPTKINRGVECSSSGESEGQRVVSGSDEEESANTIGTNDVYQDGTHRPKFGIIKGDLSSNDEDNQYSASQRLLLPPPTSSSRLQTLKQFIYKCLQHAQTQTHCTSLLIIKLSIFLVKMFFLIQPCKPLSNSWLVYPLMLLAALDLETGPQILWTVTGGLIIIHFTVVGLALNANLLCLPQEKLWDDSLL